MLLPKPRGRGKCIEEALSFRYDPKRLYLILLPGLMDSNAQADLMYQQMT